MSSGCLAFVIYFNVKQTNLQKSGDSEQEKISELFNMWNSETDLYSVFYSLLCVYLIGSFVFLWYELKKFQESMQK